MDDVGLSGVNGDNTAIEYKGVHATRCCLNMKSTVFSLGSSTAAIHAATNIGAARHKFLAGNQGDTATTTGGTAIILTFLTTLGGEDSAMGYVATLNTDGSTGTCSTNLSGSSITAVDGNLYTCENGYITGAIGNQFNGTATGTTTSLRIMMSTTTTGTTEEC